MFYKKHLFICTNQKINGSGCATISPSNIFDFAKSYLCSLAMWGVGKYRVSKSGCLGLCVDGPVCVIYPDGIWYKYKTLDDIKEIIDSNLLNDHIVDRLQIKPNQLD
jgi:(2Fe-2S) ferredoxin